MNQELERRLSSSAFEDLQLKAHMVFCRACGLMDDVAVPMVYQELLYLDEQILPGGASTYHVYRCPRCGHRAMSERH